MILAVDTASGAVQVAAEYESPPEACAPDEPAILFKSSSIRGDRLYACTQTEVLVYQLPEFSVVAYISLPFFNDLHHVLPTEDETLLVAISGLDMVVEVTMDGTVLHEWSVIPGEDPWDRFSRTVDYRRVASTKPHHAHPNHLFLLDGEPWATRFELRDAISLQNPDQRIDIAIERPHDGVLKGDALYFTTVDGHVLVAGAKDHRVREVKDLTTAHRRDELLGWCRGILVADDGTWVGFSRIRPTKTRENVGWVLRGFRKDLGTRIGRYDLETMACLQQINLEDAGMGAVFSILPAPAFLSTRDNLANT
jgi:hypothetical protein